MGPPLSSNFPPLDLFLFLCFFLFPVLIYLFPGSLAHSLSLSLVIQYLSTLYNCFPLPLIPSVFPPFPMLLQCSLNFSTDECSLNCPKDLFPKSYKLSPPIFIWDYPDLLNRYLVLLPGPESNAFLVHFSPLFQGA